MAEQPFPPNNGAGPEEAPDLQNQDPAFAVKYFNLGLAYLQTYGWFILFGLIALAFLIRKLTPVWDDWRRKQEIAQDYRNYDEDSVSRRQEGMEAARRRMQERHDSEAARYSEQQKQKEEQKRKEKIEDWDRHKQGKGYRSKIKATDDANSRPPTTQKKPPKTDDRPTPTYRQTDYNPLSGTSGPSCSFRPGRRGGSGGGGS